MNSVLLFFTKKIVYFATLQLRLGLGCSWRRRCPGRFIRILEVYTNDHHVFFIQTHHLIHLFKENLSTYSHILIKIHIIPIQAHVFLIHRQSNWMSYHEMFSKTPASKLKWPTSGGCIQRKNRLIVCWSKCCELNSHPKKNQRKWNNHPISQQKKQILLKKSSERPRGPPFFLRRPHLGSLGFRTRAWPCWGGPDRWKTTIWFSYEIRIGS